MSASHIKVVGVNKVFNSGEREVVALKDINLEVPSGQFVCLLGPSGCGKSTLLNAIAGFSLPSSGAITTDGKRVTAPGPDRGMVFQEYALFPWMTIAQNIAFGLEIKGVARAEIQARVAALLDKLGLSDFKHRFPKDLSGGMRQRVAIARVLALDSPIMLMDEPFGALDAQTRTQLQEDLLKLWNLGRKTIVFVTHDIAEAIALADRTLVLSRAPAQIVGEHAITIARPRDIRGIMTHPDFAALYQRIRVQVQ
jgi:NitT/TauT family transport system ATP-binding protein